MDQAVAAEKTSKLIIRVKIDKSTDPTDPFKIKSEPGFFNLPRMVVACTTMLLLFGGYYYFSGSVEIQFATPPDLEVPIVEPTSSASKKISVDSEVSGVIPVNTAGPTEVILLSEKAETLAVESVDILINEETRLSEAASASSISTEVMDEELTEEVEKTAVNLDSDSSKYISRAQFTNGINEREPVDIIEGIVPAKTEGLKRIYFFTELAGLKGQTIHHQWFHEDKLKSDLKFKIGGNHWRVNSSKRLNSAGAGNWQVKVVNAKGELLLSKTFDYQLP